MMEEKRASIGDHNDIDEKTPFNAEDGDIFDSSKVKFVNGGAKADTSLPEVHVDLKEKKKENEFCGLTKEELLQYADDPFWVRVRIVMLVAFWVLWVGMLAAAVLIIVFAPKCPPRPKLDWWQNSAVYQVYPRSFKDSDNDGVGDLKGIHEKLGYFIDLNISALWLNPIYPSSNLDFGYDITDFTAINPEFGTMNDFEDLRSAMRKNGLRLILDFVPNHTSRNHSWFEESRQGGDDNDFADFYVWHEGRNGGADPPNNWISVFGGPAWTWDEVREAYYLHQFLPEQPDLNLRNADVVKEMEKSMLFWLGKGVDGFRVDAAPHFFEAENFADESLSGSGTGEADYQYLLHNQTKYLAESYELITKWRSLLDNYVAEEGRKHPRLLVVEATGDINQTMGFYEHGGKKGAHMPMNFNLMELNSNCNAMCIHRLVKDWMDNKPREMWSNWRTGNHDHSRVATRMGSTDWINAVNMLTLTLPGTAITYYGEELGMVNVDISYELTKDTRALRAGEDNYASVSRDPERTPMQWTDGHNAGFSHADQTWLPISPDYREWNVQTQQAHGSGVSNLQVYGDVAKLRSEPSMQWGELVDHITDDTAIYAYLRKAIGFPTYMVAINFGTLSRTVNLQRDETLVPEQAIIAATTKNFSPRRVAAFQVGTSITMDNVKLHSMEGIVVRWEYTAPSDAAEE